MSFDNTSISTEKPQSQRRSGDLTTGRNFKSINNSFTSTSSDPHTSPLSPLSPLISTPFLDPWHIAPHNQPQVAQVDLLSPTPRRIASSPSILLMDFTSSSLESSWSVDDNVTAKGKEREVIWDIHRSSPTPRSGISPLPSIRSRSGPSNLGVGIPNGTGRGISRVEKWFRGSDSGGAIPTEIWGNIVSTSKGRFRVLKVLQYTLKTYLYLLSIVARFRPLSPWFKSNIKRMKLATSTLSLARKCLLLFNSLHPLTHILSPHPTSAPVLIRRLIDLSSAISDDIFVFSLLGILNRRQGRVAERWSNRFWLLETVIGLWTLHLRTIPHLNDMLSASTVDDRLLATNGRTIESDIAHKQLVKADWTNRKLLADLAFVSYDVFNLTWIKEPLQCFTGLMSGLISCGLMYDEQWDASLAKG